MSRTLTFQDAYREKVTAAGGARLRLRLLRPADKQKLAEGFQRLSAASRYRRFFHYKQVLTPADLRYFTAVDGVHHLAIGAFAWSPTAGEEAVVGVACFIGCPESATRAEFSLVVTDAYQGRGIGRLLLNRLVTAAAERGITTLRGDLLADNSRMQRLITHLYPDAVFRREDGLVTVDCTVPRPAPATLLVIVLIGTLGCVLWRYLADRLLKALAGVGIPLWRPLTGGLHREHLIGSLRA